jgi:hypothetical protein
MGIKEITSIRIPCVIIAIEAHCALTNGCNAKTAPTPHNELILNILPKKDPHNIDSCDFLW